MIDKMWSKKTLALSLSLILVLFCIWYLVFKEYDYRITFKTFEPTGSIYYNILEWNNFENPKDKVVTTLSTTPFSSITQELKISDSIIKIDWHFDKVNDSTTKVIVDLRDENNSLKQKLLIPFTKTDFEKRSLLTVKSVKYALKELEKKFKLGKVDEDTLKSRFCVYIPIECKMFDKANKMIYNDDFIMDFIRQNDLKLGGDPFLQVKKWDVKNETIAFDFCFPIEFKNDLPKSDELFYKRTNAQKSLKTVFNGNYRISDRSWFKILDYAESNNIRIDSLPTEVYKNDPHSGGDELKWVAEIYMPIKEE